MAKLPFVEKYKPSKLEDMILDEEQRALFKTYISQKNISNLLLIGSPGLGKTTLAKVLVTELDAMFLYINASVENGIDTIRYKVREFCGLQPLDDCCKIVILDEADSVTKDAQSALRNVIEENLNDTRFVLTGNFLNKIIDALQSRCTPIVLKASQKDIVEKCINILKAEKIAFKREDIVAFHEQIVKKLYPDIRSIINNLEHWAISGTLTPRNVSDESDHKVIISYLKGAIEAKTKLSEVRQHVLNNEMLFGGNYQLLAGALFDACGESPAKQVVIANYLHKMSQVLDPEIQFTALVYELMTQKTN